MKRCPECGCATEERIGLLQYIDERVGPYVVENAVFTQCESCGTKLFPPETAKKLGEARDRARDLLVRERPISEFVSSQEAAGILGTSRQNLGKRRRVLYSARIGKTNLYLRRSVEQLCSMGDGRLVLWGEVAEPAYSSPSCFTVSEFDYSKAVDAGSQNATALKEASTHQEVSYA